MGNRQHTASGSFFRRIQQSSPGSRQKDAYGDDAPLDEQVLYEQALRHGRGQSNPVIVIPGIMGSRLVAAGSNRSIWGDFRRKFRHRDSESESSGVALPMDKGKTLDRLYGGAQTDGAMRYVTGSIAGMPVRINAYGDVLKAMGVGGTRMGSTIKQLDGHHSDYSQSTDAFEFDYDWRRSIDESAARLGQFIRQATRYIQLQRGNYDSVKFDIVAHSMGGLVARYFLQYGEQLMPREGALPVPDWAGASQVESVVIIGTPNAGSLFALERLFAGMPRNPLMPAYDPVVLGTMPAVYQLLPRLRHKTFARSDVNGASTSALSDFTRLDFWQDINCGLADTEKARQLAGCLPGVESVAERRDIALEHLDKCLAMARSVHAALDRVTRRPEKGTCASVQAAG
jgi:pimeloyl-ACP methyl ester carboxylesterase